MNSRPIPFLDSIAYAYTAHSDEFHGDFSRVCFIFPNKRAGTFFSDRLRRSLPHDAQGPGPHITSIADVVALWSRRVVDSRIDLLFTLYDCYCAVIRRMGEQPVDFARFRSWGEVVISDFNEVEMYLVDPRSLFSNLKSEKQIATDYLSDEQKALVEEYFGYKPELNPALNFWTHYNNPVPIADHSSKRRFIRFWEILYPLYELFCETLEKRGLTFSGKSYRQALDNLKEYGSAMIPFERVVMVGFNALTSVELDIFRTLSKMKVAGTDLPLADFYWDCTGAPMADKDNPATYFVSRNMKPGRFPSRYSAEVERSATASLPERMELIASPSAVMQTKIAGQIANELLGRTITDSKGRQHPIPPEKIAVVLPDEGLLLPMMHSLPERASSVNITMGYPLKLTSAATFVRLVRTLQRHSRITDGRAMFIAEDVLVLLAHPFVRVFLGNEVVATLHDRLRSARSFAVEAGMLAAASPQAATLFAHVPKDAAPLQALAYLRLLLANISDALASRADTNEATLIDFNVDGENLRLYTAAIDRLQMAVEHHGISTDAHTLMLMTERVLAGERVQLEGRPLRGLQVMGMLETRCLDFDYVIITSMNEEIYPRRLNQRTFIPNNLRGGYGMATLSHRESIFAYYFYRMISRAKEVYMIYDSRSEGMKSGDVSRYALQLRHLYARDRIQLRSCSFNLKTIVPEPVSIPKSTEIQKLIEEYFTPDSDRALSVSSLQTFMNCELKFYLTHLRGLRDDDEMDDQMNAAQMGTVMHAVMEEIYKGPAGSAPYTVTDAHLAKWLITADDGSLPLHGLVRRMINEHFYELPPSDRERPLPLSVEGQANVFVRMARQVIDYDRTLTPFLYRSSEVKSIVTWNLGHDMTPNMLFLIDRQDEAGGSPRIVDYKTGRFHLRINSMADLFSDEQPAKELFQLITYACLQAEKDPSVPPYGFQLQIYPLGKMVGNASRPDAWIKETKAVPMLGNTPLELTEDLIDEFRSQFRVLLERLRDPSRPFTGRPGCKACTYCPFRDSLCSV